jgi:regulator of cell morphogenesis and NO signaling
MKIRFSPDTILGELADRYPQTLAVFERFGIESGRGARSRLAQVGRDYRLSYAEVALALAAVLPTAVDSLDWSCRPLGDLTAHVVTTFHEPVRRELARLQQIAARLQGHGNAHRRALTVILYELTRLRSELEAHMRAEERELFPLIETLRAGEVADEARGRCTHLRAAVEAEHVDALQTLRMFEQLTDGYRPPKDACSTVHELYRRLEELQQLQRLHAAFERDVLFPHASGYLVPPNA